MRDAVKSPPGILSIIATLAVCFGSFIVAAVPRDGSSTMLAFPLWLGGGALFVFSLIFALVGNFPPKVAGFVALLGLAGGLSIGLSLLIVFAVNAK